MAGQAIALLVGLRGWHLVISPIIPLLASLGMEELFECLDSGRLIPFWGRQDIDVGFADLAILDVGGVGGWRRA